MVGYKQTDIGLIPIDWDLRIIGEFFDFKNGLNKEKKFFGYGTPIVNYMDVFNNRGITKKNIKGLVFVNNDEIRNYEVRKGDVFFTRTSETTDEIGITSVVVDELENTVFSGFILRARPKNNDLSVGFKKYCFSSESVRKEIVSKSSYTTRALTNGTLLSNVQIPLPPLPEQEAIAEVLSDTDALIGALEKRIAKKRLIKQGAMQTLLTPKDDWEVKKLGEVAEIKKGSALSKNKLIDNGIYPCILYGELFTTYKEVINEVVSKTNHEEGIKSKSGDILFPGSTTTTGIDLAKASALLFNNILLGGDIIIVRNIIGYNSEFVSYFLNQISKNEIAKKTKGITIHHLYGNDLRDIEIALPLITEQTHIATILSDMDSEIDALEKKLSKTKELKQGLMQQLLTGKIRLYYE